MSRNFRLLGVLVGAFVGTVLAGCGQTGGLYLPDKDAEVVSPGAEPGTATPADPADDADAERKREEQRQPAPQ